MPFLKNEFRNACWRWCIYKWQNLAEVKYAQWSKENWEPPAAISSMHTKSNYYYCLSWYRMKLILLHKKFARNWEINRLWSTVKSETRKSVAFPTLIVATVLMSFWKLAPHVGLLMVRKLPAFIFYVDYEYRLDKKDLGLCQTFYLYSNNVSIEKSALRLLFSYPCMNLHLAKYAFFRFSKKSLKNVKYTIIWHGQSSLFNGITFVSWLKIRDTYF